MTKSRVPFYDIKMQLVQKLTLNRTVSYVEVEMCDTYLFGMLNIMNVCPKGAYSRYLWFPWP